MASRNTDDFGTHYRILCLQSKVFPLKSVTRFVQRTGLSCPVEGIRKEHWPFFLETLQSDNSLAKIDFSCNLSHASQQQTSKKKQKIMDKYFPVPYGCSAPNISALCRAVASVISTSQRLIDVRLENICLRKGDVEVLAESLSRSKIKILSLADSLIDDESFEILCQKLYNSQVSYLNLSSCHISGNRLRSLCRLLKFNKDKRAKEIYFLGLRNHNTLLDEMDGLNRVTLNDNDFGDEGVEMIMEYLEDDLWTKVMDFQKCGIGNEGAKCILNALRSNVTFQAIDLRLNNIDESYIKKISLQLSLNNSGKELMLDLGPLWTPRKLTIRTPRRRLRTKLSGCSCPLDVHRLHVPKVVKSPPKVKVFPEKPPSSSENPFIFTHDMLNLKSTESTNNYTQTDVIPVDEEIKKIQKTLSNEIKLRECLMHLLKKYKMENCMLRKEIQKLSKLDDHILIDHETFSEVKNTFEKFKSFLNVMKDYGLFECISMLGVNENTDIILKPMVVNATQKCMQLIENEPSPTTSAAEPVDSLLPGENMQLPAEECPNSANWYPCQNPDIQTVLNQNGTSTCYNQEQKEYNHVKKSSSSDKALVQRVYREVRENYSNSSHSGHPSFPPKLIARRPEMPVRKRPKSNSKNSVMKDISKIEATHKLKHLRTTSREFYNAVTKEIDQCDECEVQNSLSLASSGRSPGVHSLVHKKTVSSQTPSAVSSVRQSASTSADESQDATTTLTSGASGNRSPESDASTLHEPASNASDPRGAYKVPPNARPKLKGAVKKGKSLATNSPSVVSSVYKNFTSSSVGSQNPVLSSEPARNGSSKASKAESAAGGKVHSNALPSGGTESSKPVSVAPSSSSSSVESYNSQEGVEQGLHYSSDGKNDSSKSYLESVSDASTDKDVKSMAESEVYSMASAGMGSKIPSETSVAVSRVDLVDAASNEVRDQSKSSKSSKNVSKNSHASLTQGNVKKITSDSSVPSLSDITTVSSRSLNTDSVMGQLSNDES